MSWCHIFDEHWCSNQTWGHTALKSPPFPDLIQLFRKRTHLFIRPLCPSGGPSHQWLAQSEAAALWKWWSFITCDVVTRCNQLMYPTKLDKSPFASWLSTFCGWQELLWGQTQPHFEQGSPSALWDTPAAPSFSHWMRKRESLVSLLLSICYSSKKKKEKRKNDFYCACMSATLRDIKRVQWAAGANVGQWWVVPGRLVEVICLLRGSREDVEKPVPSQLLQGVLQCRGLTEKVEGKRQLVCSLSASIYHCASLPLHTTAHLCFTTFSQPHYYTNSLQAHKKKQKKK